MTREELLTVPQYLCCNDIQKIFDCGYSKSVQIIREIKSVSNRMDLKGKVTITDYEEWFNLRQSRGTLPNTANAKTQTNNG